MPTSTAQSHAHVPPPAPTEVADRYWQLHQQERDLSTERERLFGQFLLDYTTWIHARLSSADVHAIWGDAADPADVIQKIARSVRRATFHEDEGGGEARNEPTPPVSDSRRKAHLVLEPDLHPGGKAVRDLTALQQAVYDAVPFHPQVADRAMLARALGAGDGKADRARAYEILRPLLARGLVKRVGQGGYSRIGGTPTVRTVRRPGPGK